MWCAASDIFKVACRLIDLFFVTCFFNADTGPTWKYFDETSGLYFKRSQGLNIAIFNMFLQGAFSSDPKFPLRVYGNTFGLHAVINSGRPWTIAVYFR